MMAREETNMDRKNAMLDYLGELMEDANDFCWQSAKLHMQYYFVGWRKGK